MPAYIFEAVDVEGRSQRGAIEAASPAGARQILRERNLLPVSIGAGGQTRVVSASGAVDLRRLLRPGVGPKALAALTRQLSTLISADVRIEEALRLVAAETASTAAGPVLLSVRNAILEGRSFAAALGEHPAVFPEFYRASIASGERSGRLPDVLNHLTDFVESRERARQKVQLALIYPALLAAVSAAMIVLLLIYVVPDIVKVFVARGADLPLLTRGLIALSNGFQRFGLYALASIIGLVLLARRWIAVPANRLAVAAFLATRRPFAQFTRQVNAARFAASLATLVQSDVPLVEALDGAAAVTPNLYVRQQVRAAAARVREGSSLSGALREAGCFPTLLLAVVASGESSGKLGAALGKAAADLDRELEALTAAIVALVEPAVLLFMGGIVLMLVLSILLPIVNLNNLAGL